MRTVKMYLKEKYTDEELCQMWDEIANRKIIEKESLVRKSCEDIFERTKRGEFKMPISGAWDLYIAMIWSDIASILADKYIGLKKNSEKDC